MELTVPSLSWIHFILVLFIIYIVYMCWNFRTFSKQGIPMNGTPVPVFGTLLPLFQNGFVKLYDGAIAKYGKVMGDFDGRRPVLTTVDPELIKQVYIKEHIAFPHRSAFASGDNLSEKMLTNIMDYEHWKYIRSVMSPTFSSGKLKRMMQQINKCAKQLQEHLAEAAQLSKSVDMKEYAGSFTMDVIASTAFGLDINTKEDHNNPFVVYGRKAFDVSVMNPYILVSFFLPFLKPLLRVSGVSFFDKKVLQFFSDVTKKTIESRKEESDRDDFLYLMMTAHKATQEEESDLGEHGINTEKPKREMSEEELIAQALLFFLAGYDTTASSISFLAYNLACNPDKQDKLIEEIDSVMGNKDKVTDQDLHEMSYLEMCINESLRLYPPIGLTDRQAVKDVEIKGIKIPKGGLVRVPIFHMHRYEEFYPDPDSFIPERFSPEEKKGRDPILYMPFGAGPRQCIAARLALLEIKVAIAHILKTHKFVKAPETEEPIKFGKLGLIKAVNGIWLRLAPRQ